ncbi:MAG: aspartyl/glutamyl-tRNA amidotransferase subunit C [Gemmatimonadota bacterium]
MRRIDVEHARHVARLARLRLGEEELRRLAAEMETLLTHFAALQDVGELPRGPSGRGLAPRLRPDVPGPDPLTLPIGELAPDWRDGFFVVPRLPALEPGS